MMHQEFLPPKCAMKTGVFWEVSFFLLLSATLVFAGLQVNKFTLEPGYNKVTVRWEVQGEANLRGYEIQRGLNERDFSKIGFVDYKQASGSINKYEYVDQTVFKQQSQTGRTYYYRLKITKKDGSFEYSKVENVTPTISSARQTWGSIKAMFR
ncbi:MAG: hypothetical protein ACE5I1_05555 [bacterium]